MIKYIKILFVTILWFAFIPCYSQIFLDEEELIRYKGLFSSYPDSLTDHFPDWNNEGLLYVEMSKPGSSVLNVIYFAFEYDKSEIEKLKEEFNARTLSHYHFTDSCLMMTYYDSTFFESTLPHLKQCDNLYPIPNFEFLGDPSLNSDFYKQAELYVLEAKKGVFLEEALLNKKWVKKIGLPVDWEHGYSKGVLISGCVVAYWLEVW